MRLLLHVFDNFTGESEFFVYDDFALRVPYILKRSTDLGLYAASGPMERLP